MIGDLISRLGFAALPALIALSLCVLVEYISPRVRYRLRDRFPGAIYVLLSPILGALLLPPLGNLWRSLDIPPIFDTTALPDVVTFTLLIVIVDFAYYWEHRFEHRFLWPIHGVHHSLTELHAANDYAHPLELFTRYLFVLVPVSMIGFDSVALPVAVLLFLNFWAYFVHAPTRVHIGPLRKVIVDERFHRIHHSLDPKHFDRNFAPVFSIWDQMFGTAYFPADDEHPEVGLAGIEPPSSPWSYLAKPLHIIRKGQNDQPSSRNDVGERRTDVVIH